MKPLFSAFVVLSFWVGAEPVCAKDLHNAARKGDVEKVVVLIEAGEPVGELDGAVGAPLHWAAARGHEDVARALLEHGADPNQFAHAPDKLTPLHLAASGGHLALVSLLVDAGAELAAGEGSTGTPVHFAARKNRADVIAYLLEAGADPGSRTSPGAYGFYPLHWAAEAGATDAIAVLLGVGFPVDAPNPATGVTALHLAVFNVRPEAARVLIEAGANPLARSSTLGTPVKLAQAHPEMEQLLASFGFE